VTPQCSHTYTCSCAKDHAQTCTAVPCFVQHAANWGTWPTLLPLMASPNLWHISATCTGQPPAAAACLCALPALLLPAACQYCTDACNLLPVVGCLLSNAAC
jgi:hypothetical protein